MKCCVSGVYPETGLGWARFLDWFQGVGSVVEFKAWVERCGG